MKHLGDITKIDGYSVPVVDCVIGGSPCQDLSIAGKRSGLGGERSVLYMEQIRLVKEMRLKDEHNGRTGVDVRPRYMVWENVPGAFSSNKGEDFRIVLEELAKIKDKDAAIPVPDKGKWTTSGCIMGDGWSIAWRVQDAQFWGVPQRRRRIALVADFGGQSAPEILFVRKSLSGHSDESEPKRKETTSDASRGIGADDIFCIDGDKLNKKERKGGAACYGIGSYNSNAWKSDNPNSGVYEADIAKTLDSMNCGYPACNQGGIAVVESVPYTLKIRSGCEGGGKGALIQEDKSATLSTLQDQTLFQPIAAVDCRNGTEDTVNGALQFGAFRSLNCNNVVRDRYIVRRLTPLECERLQGYPDGWTDIGDWTDSKGKVHKTSDASRYKALGNSIALPPWKWVLKRICGCYERDATMASLFDGIGGFPYLWEQLNGKGTCLWASEIEEFPIAVTKARIG